MPSPPSASDRRTGATVAAMSNAAYEKLIAQVKETSLLSSVSWLLSWDQETMMPAGGAPHRAKQMALLAGMVHERATAPVVGELLANIEASPWLASAPLHVR